jgi:hypothetical protein
MAIHYVEVLQLPCNRLLQTGVHKQSALQPYRQNNPTASMTGIWYNIAIFCIIIKWT